MRIPSESIPQADVLDDVVRTVEAVGTGAQSFSDIAEAIGKVDRQGRYYRKAAEILGFIENAANRSNLTPKGRAFLEAPQQRDQRLVAAVLESRLIQRVVPFLEAAGNKGVTREQLENFISKVTQPVGDSMIPRRVSTILSWLDRIGMVREANGRFSVRGLPPGVGIVTYQNADEPLFPKRYALGEYQSIETRARESKGYINVLIDDAARERAEGAHRMLTNLVAARIRKAGSIPKSNQFVDLSAAMPRGFYLFEMKSTTDKNVHGQIRRAISQLYEYRYLQDLPEAKLVVVIENPPPQEKRWIIDYVVKDRNILIAWDGDRKTLKFPAETIADLGFLG
jgi:hypothetical protein